MRSVAGLTRHWTFGAIFVISAAVVISQLDHGIGSLDGNGIVRTTQSLVDAHRIEVSRPPGHPTTEFYLFGSVGWAMRAVLGRAFDAQTYLVLQGLAALITLAVFYELLFRLGTKPWLAGIATTCLAFSPQYFANAIDGEEFIFAMLFLLVAVRLLITTRATPVSLPRLCVSLVCFALATGCRPEIVFAGVLFPIYLFQTGLSWQRVAIAAATMFVATGLVWLPALLVGIHQPYESTMTLPQALLAGGYKLSFQSFGLIVFILLLATLVAAIARTKVAMRRALPGRFIHACAVALPLIFFLAFFRYATKPAYVLAGLPFLLILALDWSEKMTLAICLFTAIEAVVSIDIFRDRRLTAPFLTDGSCIRAIRQKPFYKRDYLASLSAQCDGRPAIIVADAWKTDFEYQIHRGTLSLSEQVLMGPNQHRIVSFTASSGSCLMVPRDAAYETEVLKAWHDKGYALKIERALHRRLFDRYAMQDQPESQNALPFSFFSLEGATQP